VYVLRRLQDQQQYKKYSGDHGTFKDQAKNKVVEGRHEVTTGIGDPTYQYYKEKFRIVRLEFELLEKEYIAQDENDEFRAE